MTQRQRAVVLLLAVLFLLATQAKSTLINAGSPNSLPVIPEPFSRSLTSPHAETQVSNAQTRTRLSTIANADYIAYQPEFQNIIRPNTKITTLQQRNIAFAHEAPVWLEDTNEVFFSSNRLGDTSGTNQFINLYLLNLTSNKVRKIQTTPPILMTNGATFSNGKIIICSQGLGSIGGSIVSLDPRTLRATTLLNNYFGLKFNSPNDLVVDSSGGIWFTDPSYGFEQGFREAPQLGDFLWRFDPSTGEVRLMSDGFTKPNGLVLSPDESVLYVSDSGFFSGDGQINVKNPHTIYAFDVVASSSGSSFSLQNRRVFALVDVGIPDGLKCDVQGNLYASTADGVQVFNPDGQLLGKINTPSSANSVFVKGRMIVLGEKKIYSFPVQIPGVSFP